MKCPKRLPLTTFVMVVFALLIFGNIHAFAHPSSGEHNKEFERIIFGSETYKNDLTDEHEKERVVALEAATTLSIDQFQDNNAGELETLRQFGVIRFRFNISLSDINPPPGETQLSGSNHHYYTHRGWDHTYEDDKANWPLRKKILLETTEKVFNFRNPIHELAGYDTKNNSFSALLYYIHILGDYLEDDNHQKFDGLTKSVKIKFARANPSDDNPDLFWELEKHIKVLFEDQSDTATYIDFIQDLREIARLSRKLAQTTGGINNQEKFEQAHGYAERLMALLAGDYSKPKRPSFQAVGPPFHVPAPITDAGTPYGLTATLDLAIGSQTPVAKSLRMGVRQD